MLKKFPILLLSFSLMLTGATGVLAEEKDKGEKKGESTEVIYPATETTINGLPESEVISIESTEEFHSYTLDSNYRDPKFKEIAYYTHNNRYNGAPFTMNMSITNSTSQGSEFGGGVSFTTEIKVKMIGAVETQLSGSYKEIRSTNEAVGVTGSFTVPAGKYGHLKFWYAGRGTQGTLTTKTWDPTIYGYKYTNYYNTTAKIHPEMLDVHSEGWYTN